MAVKKKGLGAKGLGINALINTEMEDMKASKPAKKKTEEAVLELDLDMIEPNRKQPRKYFDETALEELAESIRQNGIITPITVRKVDDRYQIIAGERRWRASRMAGLEDIPAYVLEVDEREAYQYALVENLQRQDLNPIEEALGYRRLMDDYGYSQEKAGEKVGRSRPYITNALRLLSLPQLICDMIASGALSAGHGRALVVLDEQKAMEAAKSILEKALT